MKRIDVLRLVYIPAVIFILSSCTKSVEKVEQKSPPISTKNDTTVNSEFKQYIILPGKQFAEGTAMLFDEVNIARLHFYAVFDSTAIYTTDTASNQYDINKLYGFADNNVFDHHKFSARFGWNWNKGALRLLAYVYNNGEVSNKPLGTIAIGKQADCTIIIKGSQYQFVLNGITTVMPRASTTATAIGYKLYPYFGGTETAPHQININIKEIE